jgi:hypothetical protein
MNSDLLVYDATHDISGVLAVSIFRVHFLDYVKMEIACGPSL